VLSGAGFILWLVRGLGTAMLQGHDVGVRDAVADGAPRAAIAAR
jgi:hypothetical protein